MTTFRQSARRSIGLLLALFLTGTVHATGPGQLRAFLDGSRHGNATFRQVVAAKDARRAQESSGTFAFARPGKFIWLYQQPYEQLLQADGEKLYMYDKDLNQVTVKLLGTALSSSPAAILFGSNCSCQ